MKKKRQSRRPVVRIRGDKPRLVRAKDLITGKTIMRGYIRPVPAATGLVFIRPIGTRQRRVFERRHLQLIAVPE